MNKPFYQEGPKLGNQYTSDESLKEALEQILPADVLAANKGDFERLGERAVGDLMQMAEDAEAHPPVHVPFDPWGRRVDEVRVSRGWEELQKVAAEEGIVATGYERKFGGYSRVVQFAKLYLYHASSSFFSCPLAMTDGAARAIEIYGDEELKKGPYKHLTSRNPKEFWTSGQWMTEREGGSDVSNTSTVAKPLGGDRYALYGSKWFTSASTSPMAMTLARIEGADAGSRGLSLFYLELRDQHGNLNKIEVHRLKDKLGTRALPTAELTLNGTTAKLVGGEGQGVKKIASLFNITRIYNSVCAVSAARRALALASDYSRKREAFGKRIIEHPLHAETLSSLFVDFEACLQLTFHLAALLGKDETGQASAEESALLRLLTPVVKLFTGKYAMSITSEAVEIFGGIGYCEDTGLPRLHRDSQVFSIWEGTTNVLSLDMLRAIEKENAFPAYMKDVRARLGRIAPRFSPSTDRVKAALGSAEAFLPQALRDGVDSVQAGARDFAFTLARVYCASLLLEKASAPGASARIQAIAERYCARELAVLNMAGQSHRAASREILGKL